MKQPETCRDMYKALMYGDTVTKPCLYSLTQKTAAYKRYVKDYRAWRRLQQQKAMDFWRNFDITKSD